MELRSPQARVPSGPWAATGPWLSLLSLLSLLAMAGCTTAPPNPSHGARMIQVAQQTDHRGSDDLLTAGLGLAGLQTMLPPVFADPARPTAPELRRRAVWNNWRGIADLSATGGYGSVYGSVADVPGREYSAFARVPGAAQPHRVLVQVPDGFDAARRCVVVAASSGSRGIYGAIAVAGAWALPKGCAVAYTDKGAGTDYVDLADAARTGLDGTRSAGGEAAFVPAAAGSAAAGSAAAGSAAAGSAAAGSVAAGQGAGEAGIAFKHAHSGDNPEADWGRHVRQAADFALVALAQAYPAQAPFTHANTRVIAVGISNGGGAVLRAAEDPEPWLDAVVAGEPNIYVEGHGARTLYDYTTQAALLMPCALLDLPAGLLPQPPVRAQALPGWDARCRALQASGDLRSGTVADAARDAHAQLRAGGFTDAAIASGALSVGFDLWRAVAATYASAYGRYAAGAQPCGFGYAALGTDFKPRSPTDIERAAWWSDGSGIPPGAGVSLLDPHATDPADPTLAGLRCLRALAIGRSADATRVQAGIAATRSGPPRAGLPVVVIHGDSDGLIPPAFSSAPYVAAARAAGRDVAFWRIANAQHFDGFLAFPGYGQRYVPLLPYVYAALDQVSAQLDGAGTVAGRGQPDLAIRARARGTAAVDRTQLHLPR